MDHLVRGNGLGQACGRGTSKPIKTFFGKWAFPKCINHRHSRAVWPSAQRTMLRFEMTCARWIFLVILSSCCPPTTCSTDTHTYPAHNIVIQIIMPREEKKTQKIGRARRRPTVEQSKNTSQDEMRRNFGNSKLLCAVEKAGNPHLTCIELHAIARHRNGAKRETDARGQKGGRLHAAVETRSAETNERICHWHSVCPARCVHTL